MSTTSQLPDASLSLLASDLPDSSTTKFMIVVFVFAIVVLALIYYSSPMRLTSVLVAAITATEKTYLEAVEMGLLSTSSVDTAEMLSACANSLSISLYVY
jgi:xanthine/uracil permease